MRIQLTNYQYRNLQEALGDDIPDYMKDIIQKRYKGDYLTKDVPQHTDKIPNVKMEVKNDEIVDYASNQLVKSMTDKLVEQMKKSEIWQEYDRFPSYLPGPLRVMMNASIPNMDRTKEDPLNIQILQKYTWFYSKEFRLPDSRLNDDSTLKSEEKDAWGKMIKSDNIKWSNNKTGISSFLTTIKRVFPQTFGNLDVEKIIRDKHFVGLREPIINYQQNVKKIGEYPLYLYITDKPDDKLRMSVSQFYDSCQNIYTGGEQGTEYNKKLLSNVFDKNSKVAYLIYNKPYKDTRGNEHPFTSIARCILRVNKDGGVMFDKVYPTNLERIFYSIITENTGIENVGETEDVYDYEGVDGLPAPYMDKYKLRTSGLNQREKINALSKRLKIDPSTITAKDDETFEVVDRTERGTKYKLERWKVVPVEDALERASDSMRVNFLDIFGNYSVEEVINGIIDGWELLQVLDLEEEYYSYFNSAHQDGEDTTIYEFLSEVYNVNDVYDIDEILTKNKINSVEWFSGNIDMDEIIERYDGEGHFIGSTLNWNHDEAYVGIDYVYYREYYEW